MTTRGLAFVLGFMLQAPVLAQGAWQDLGVSGPARAGHAIAYDSARGRTVVFGGSQWLVSSGDTWEWDGTSWMLKATSGPTPRWYHAMAYDAVRGRVVLFGGYSTLGYFGDTWEWNGVSWTPMILATGPVPRYQHQMVFDSVRGRTVMFGGTTNTTLLGDTWEWNGAAWQQVASTGPSPRASAAVAYDSARGRVVLFGGVDNTAILGDTWEWDGTSWMLKATSGPTPRFYPAMAYDSLAGLTILNAGDQNGALSDSWAWNGTVWKMLNAPLTRRLHTMVFHEQTGELLILGGYDGMGNISGQTLVWAGALPSATAYGAGCGTPPLELAASPTALPHLNSVATAVVTNAPTAFAAILVGWRNDFYGPFALPASLASLGMDGCDLLQSAEIQWLPTAPVGAGTFELNLPIPNVIDFIGGSLYLQAFSYAPGFNPAGVVLSNGLHWVVGW